MFTYIEWNKNSCKVYMGKKLVVYFNVAYVYIIYSKTVFNAYFTLLTSINNNRIFYLFFLYIQSAKKMSR